MIPGMKLTAAEEDQLLCAFASLGQELAERCEEEILRELEQTKEELEAQEGVLFAQRCASQIIEGVLCAQKCADEIVEKAPAPRGEATEHGV